MAGTDFPHLPLIRRRRGKYRHPANVFPRPTKRETRNKANYQSHSATLSHSVDQLRAIWAKDDETSDTGFVIEAGKPLLLEIDKNFDLDEVRRQLSLEVVSEEESGFVIVATEDTDLAVLREVVEKFGRNEHGGGAAAKVYNVEESSPRDRLERFASDELKARWDDIREDENVWIIAGISCNAGISTRITDQRTHESDAGYEQRQRDERFGAFEAWDQARNERIEQLKKFAAYYGGEVNESSSESGDDIPEDFSVQMRLPGVGLKDFVYNYPYLFEVAELDSPQIPTSVSIGEITAFSPATISSPDATAPAICIIDSGIEENHRLLRDSIDSASSRCFFGVDPAAVADLVKPSGHGTRVAGIVLFGETVPTSGRLQSPFWIQNARILNDGNGLPLDRAVFEMIVDVVNHFRNGPRQTRIYNHSVNAHAVCRLKHMSPWAATMDSLSHKQDVLFIQSAGNVEPKAFAKARLGVEQHLAAGRKYPDYLLERSCRVANPAQSLQAITVGSVSPDVFRSTDWNSFCDGPLRPSGFSRTGEGIFETIKPDVVEIAGDYVRSASDDVTTNPIGKSLYPDLIRTSIHGPGPVSDRDVVGTSFAAPKVTRLAGRLAGQFPKSSTLLYRALIAQSARLPDWALSASPVDQAKAIRHLGYGIPSEERATTNTDYRVTMVTEDQQRIRARQVDVYQVNLPDALRAAGATSEVMIEVCLSYSASVRRTRRDRRGYLSTWLDWHTNYTGEDAETFLERMVSSDDNPPSPVHERFDWVVGERKNYGSLTGPNRAAGTLQKDWCVLPGDMLPKNFCIAVVGHKGHSVDFTDEAKYHLVVTVDVLGQEVKIYGDMTATITDLQSLVDVEPAVIESEVDVELQ